MPRPDNVRPFVKPAGPAKLRPRRRFALQDASGRTMRLSDLQRIIDAEIAAAGGPGAEAREVEEIIQRTLDELYTNGLLPMAAEAVVAAVSGRDFEYDVLWQTRVT
jgi:hypothetical protein